MLISRSLFCLLLACSFGLTAHAQSSGCPPAPAELKFRDVPAGETLPFPPRTKFEFRVAPTPAGCGVTTVMILPGGNKVWLPAGEVYDSPDKSFQNNGGPLTFESHPSGAFNSWAGWQASSGRGNCDPSVDRCPPDSNLIRR